MTLLIENIDWASMPALPDDHVWSTWTEATKVVPGEVRKEEGIWEYHGDLKGDWCIHSGIFLSFPSLFLSLPNSPFHASRLNHIHLKFN
jgi:hypothetical protein